MNGWSDLETLLRSWTPRRPSPRVEPRLFGGSEDGDAAFANATLDASGSGALEHIPFRFGWLAPATVSLLLACVLFNHHNSFVLSESATGGPLVAAALSNQSAAAWLPGSFQAAQNSLPVDAFEWTNASRRSPSSGPSVGN